MTIEIRGTGFENKGAELMLRTIVARMRAAHPDARLVMNARRGTPMQRRALGLDSVVWLHWRRHPRLERLHNAVVPRFAGRWPLRGTLSPRQIDLVFDASGYAYGDLWDERGALTAATYYRIVKASGGAVILLPQQLGPFEKPAMRRAFVEMARHVDLIYARDRLSLDAAAGVLGNDARLRLAPDFTTSTKGTLPADGEKLRGHVCIVPNSQMVRKTDPEMGAAYRRFLEQAMAQLEARGVPWFVLLHDRSGRDAAFLDTFDRVRARAVKVVSVDDPLHIKGLIGVSAMSISSRFHALVSALSQGVPSIGTGWSHKYEMLFEEYGVRDCLLTRDELLSGRTALLDRLLDPAERQRLRARLEAAAEQHRARTEAMWAEIAAFTAARSTDGVPLSARRPASA